MVRDRFVITYHRVVTSSICDIENAGNLPVILDSLGWVACRTPGLYSLKARRWRIGALQVLRPRAAHLDVITLAQSSPGSQHRVVGTREGNSHETCA